MGSQGLAKMDCFCVPWENTQIGMSSPLRHSSVCDNWKQSTGHFLWEGGAREGGIDRFHRPYEKLLWFVDNRILGDLLFVCCYLFLPPIYSTGDRVTINPSGLGLLSNALVAVAEPTGNLAPDSLFSIAKSFLSFSYLHHHLSPPSPHQVIRHPNFRIFSPRPRSVFALPSKTPLWLWPSCIYCVGYRIGEAVGYLKGNVPGRYGAVHWKRAQEGTGQGPHRGKHPWIKAPCEWTNEWMNNMGRQWNSTQNLSPHEQHPVTLDTSCSPLPDRRNSKAIISHQGGGREWFCRHHLLGF